jgi:hypothetical protein
MCADFISPQLRTDLPRIRVVRGTIVRFHVGFRPISLQLSRVGGKAPWRLELARLSSWKVAGPGVYTLFARVIGGDASYVFRIV